MVYDVLAKNRVASRPGLERIINIWVEKIQTKIVGGSMVTGGDCFRAWSVHKRRYGRFKE